MRLRTLIVLLSALPVAVCAVSDLGKSGTFEDLIRQGHSAYLASDLNRAESAYSQACPDNLVSTYPVAKVVTCDNVLASVDEARGNLVRAEQRFLRAVALAEQAGPAYRPLYCARLIDLGEHYHRQGRIAEAENSLMKSVDLARGLTGEMPQLLPEALIRLGALYPDSPQPERGRAPLTEALAIITASAGDSRLIPPVPEIARAHGALGMIDLTAGDHRGAQANLRESIALTTSALGEEHPVTAAYQTNLALALIAEGQFDRAGMLLRRAQFVLESQPVPPVSELAVIYAAMSSVVASQNKMARAGDFARRALAILNLQPRPDVRAVAIAQATLAGIYLHTHDLVSAEAILPEAVEIQRASAVSPDTLAASLRLLAELRAEQRRWPQAEALYREALSICERPGIANTNPDVAPLLRGLADVLKHDGGSSDEVRALESRARDILRSTMSSSPRA